VKVHFLEKDEELHQRLLIFSQQWNDDSTFFETLTSGSTGRPKIIRIEKRHAVASAWATIRFLKLKPLQNALLCLNIETIGGKMMWIRSVVNSLNLYVVSPQSNPLKNSDVPIDFVALAPIQLHTILQETPDKLSNISTIIVGGGEVSPATHSLLVKYGLTVFQTFGMSETVSHIALKKIGVENESCYTALDHVTISEVDGLLCVDAPTIGIDHLVSQDTVRLINPHQFVWLGRSDFVINSGGVKIQIESLERELQAHIKERFFVFPKKDDKLGEAVALIVLGKVQSCYCLKKFYCFLSHKYHTPKYIAFVDQFEWTKSGKINRIATFNSVQEFYPIT